MKKKFLVPVTFHMTYKFRYFGHVEVEADTPEEASKFVETNKKISSKLAKKITLDQGHEEHIESIEHDIGRGLVDDMNLNGEPEEKAG